MLQKLSNYYNEHKQGLLIAASGIGFAAFALYYQLQNKLLRQQQQLMTKMLPNSDKQQKQFQQEEEEEDLDNLEIVGNKKQVKVQGNGQFSPCDDSAGCAASCRSDSTAITSQRVNVFVPDSLHCKQDQSAAIHNLPTQNFSQSGISQTTTDCAQSLSRYFIFNQTTNRQQLYQNRPVVPCQATENFSFFHYICLECLSEKNFAREKVLLKRGIRCFFTELLPILCEECFHLHHQQHRHMRLSRLKKDILSFFEHQQCVCGNTEIYVQPGSQTQLIFAPPYNGADLALKYSNHQCLSTIQKQEETKKFDYIFSDPQVWESRLKNALLSYDTVNEKSLERAIYAFSQNPFTSNLFEIRVRVAKIMLESLESVTRSAPLTLTLCILLSEKELLTMLFRNDSRIYEVVQENMWPHFSPLHEFMQKFTKIVQETPLERLSFSKQIILNHLALAYKILQHPYAAQEFAEKIIQISYLLQNKTPRRNFAKYLVTSDLGYHLAALKEIDFVWRSCYSSGLLQEIVRNESVLNLFLRTYLEYYEKILPEEGLKNGQTIYEKKIVCLEDHLTDQQQQLQTAKLLEGETRTVRVATPQKPIFLAMSLTTLLTPLLLILNETSNCSKQQSEIASILSKLTQKSAEALPLYFFFHSEGQKLLSHHRLPNSHRIMRETENRTILQQIGAMYSRPAVGDYDQLGFLLQHVVANLVDSKNEQKWRFSLAECSRLLMAVYDSSIAANLGVQENSLATKRKLLINAFQLNELSIAKDDFEAVAARYCLVNEELYSLLDEVTFYDADIDFYELKPQYHKQIYPYLLNRSAKTSDAAIRLVQMLHAPQSDTLLGTDFEHPFTAEDSNSTLQREKKAFAEVELDSILYDLRETDNVPFALLALRWLLFSDSERALQKIKCPENSIVVAQITQLLKEISLKHDTLQYQLSAEAVLQKLLLHTSEQDSVDMEL